MWSLSDALQLQTLLDRAGIPVFMGPEPATAVEAVTSNFASGVSVRVTRVGLPWALQAMLNYTSANEPPQQQEEEWHKLPIRCPKCQATEVISSVYGLSHKTPWTTLLLSMNGPAVHAVTTGKMKAL